MIFKDYALFYDILYNDKDYDKESRFIVEVLRRMIPHAKRIIEFGSGTGKHGKLLAESGFQVLGVEKSKEMYELCKSYESLNSIDEPPAGGSFSCTLGDALTTKLGADFDVALALFHVFSYQTKKAQAEKMLLNANRHLKDGGIFVLDYWFAPALHHLIPSTRVKRITNQNLDLTRLAEPEYSPHSKCVKVNYLTYAEDLRSRKIQKIEECHEMRAFLIEEIEQLAKECGFTLIESRGWMTSLQPTPKTWSAYSVLQKKPK